MGGRGRARASFLFRAFLPLLIAMPLAWVFERFLPGYGAPGVMRTLRLLGSVVGWFALYALAIHRLARGIGFRGLLAEMTWPWSAAGRGGGASRD